MAIHILTIVSMPGLIFVAVFACNNTWYYYCIFVGSRRCWEISRIELNSKLNRKEKNCNDFLLLLVCLGIITSEACNLCFNNRFYREATSNFRMDRTIYVFHPNLFDSGIDFLFYNFIYFSLIICVSNAYVTVATFLC